MQIITVGTTDGNVSAVEGIDPGTVVAADNFNKLTDGAKVIVRTASRRDRQDRRRKQRRNDSPVSPSRPFILRPVATSLLMVAILLTGFIAYQTTRRFPRCREVDYPTIQVVTFYPGASPDVTASAITAPLERQFGELPGLNQMTSISSGGSSIITLQFALNLNIDVAEQEVQAAINAAQTYLPPGLPVAADLQQIQSGRRADPDAGRLVEKFSALAGRGLHRHAARAKNLAGDGRRTGDHQRRTKTGESAFRSIPPNFCPTASTLTTFAPRCNRPA